MSDKIPSKREYETNIDIIVEEITNAKNHGHPVALIVGAGVSATAHIPTANGFIDVIKEQYAQKCASISPKTYADYMKILTPTQRKELINEYVDKADINQAHLYIASMVRDKIVDRVLTPNFDPLLARSLSLENVFPGIYDFAALSKFDATKTANVSIFHLNGQKDGYLLLNTEDEVNKHFKDMKPLIEDTLKGRVIIVVGYSGDNDPVVRHLETVAEFEHSLFWVGYKENAPSENLKKDILSKDNYSYYLRGFDADSFFMTLAQKLEIAEPSIVAKPFSFLKEAVEMVGEFSKQDQKTDPLKEAKGWIDKSISVFENGEHFNDVFKDSEETLKDEELIKLTREAWLNDKFEDEEKLRAYITVDSPKEVIGAYTNFLVRLGYTITQKAHKETDVGEKETLYLSAIAKEDEALRFSPKNRFALNNLSSSLKSLAKLKTGADKEKLLKLSIQNAEKCIKLFPDYVNGHLNLGQSFFHLALMKEDDEREKFKNKAIEIIEKSEMLEEGSGLYDLSCFQSILNNKEEAIASLIKIIEMGKAPAISYMKTDDDLKNIIDDERLKKYLDTDE